jgi:hypothetical protein
MRFHWIVAGLVLTGATIPGRSLALDKPTGAPLVMSDIETEQPIPLAYLSPDGKTAACSNIRLHWSPSISLTAQDDTASFALDIAADSPGAATFTAQLWSASLAGSLAWQKPWQGARWKIFETPATDGTGIDAGLAVGMIATSARRPYPKDTLVIGNLHPDSSLGAVSRLADRLDAAAKAGITRVIIPKVEQFETDGSGDTIDIMSHAADLKLTCIPVDNIVQATEVVMNDPLPDPPAVSGAPKYSVDVASYIDGFAQRERTEAQSGLLYAPKEEQLAQYPPVQAAVWRQVYAEVKQGNTAYKSGQVYVAWRLLARANSRMRGMNALAGDQLTNFDVKTALETSDDLRQQLHDLMTPPPIDRAELQSGMLIAEMADWAYDIEALLEGSELVTKQTFSQRSDATTAERDRAREMILSANEEAKYLLDGASFYTGLLPHLGDPNPLPANTNAANLLPQLIPAQLATAQIFTDGIRPQANELRVGLLFDPRLAAYVNVLREEQGDWNSRVRRKANDAAAAAAMAPASTNAAPADATNNAAAVAASATNSVPLQSTPANATNNGPVGFDPGNAYAPPHTVVESNAEPKNKLSDVAQCLIWVNTDCEIATLDEKYLRLTGTVDPATHIWHVKDRTQLETLLQLAENGAQEGSAFAQQALVNPDIFAMILERASYLRQHGDDSNALAGLREYWRCALLGNMCWQLAHTHKAAAVDLSAETGGGKKSNKDKKTAEKGAVADKDKSAPATNTNSTNSVAGLVPPATNAAPENAGPEKKPTETATAGNEANPNSDKVAPVEPAPTNAVVDVPAVPPSGPVVEPTPASVVDTNIVPVAPVASIVTPEPPVAPPANVVTPATNEPPVAPIASERDMENHAPPAAVPVHTNAAPAPAAEEHAFPRALPVDVSTNASPPSDSAATGEPTAANPPVATPAKDDEYTGGDNGTPPVALPVNPPPATTNSAPAIQ